MNAFIRSLSGAIPASSGRCGATSRILPKSDSSFSLVSGFAMVPRMRSPCNSASMPAVSTTRSSSPLMIAIADSSPSAANARIVSMPSRSGMRRSQRMRSNQAPGRVTAANACPPSAASVTWTTPAFASTVRTQFRTWL